VTLVVLVVAWTPPLQTLLSRRILTAGGRREVAIMAADSDPEVRVGPHPVGWIEAHTADIRQVEVHPGERAINGRTK
jgi:hypothetical protein